MSDEFEKYRVEPDEFEQYHSSNYPQEKEKSWLEKAGNLADKFNKGVEATGLPAAAGGFYQGVGDVGASLGNVIARPLGHPIPHPEFRKYFDNSLASSIGFGAGELGSQIPLYASGAGFLGKLGLGAEAGLSGKAIQGLLAGSLLGEDKEGGRKLGAALGAGMPIAGAAIKGLSGLRSKKIADKVLTGFANTEKHYGKEFSSIFNESRMRGIKHLEKVPSKMELLKKGGEKNYLQALKDFNNHPTIENAHSAQSDLAKYVSRIGKPANKLERDARNEAKRLSETIREKMSSHLVETGNPDLAMRYNQARHGFKEDVVPYMNSKVIKNMKEGNIRSKHFAKKIAEDERFMAKLGQKKHPEIALRENITKGLSNKIVQYGLGTGLGGLGFYEAAKLLK